MRALLHALVALAVLLGLARTAAAHPLDMGYLKLHSNDRTLAVQFDLEASVGAKLVGTTPEQFAGAGALKYATALADASYRLAPIVTDAGPCTWTTTTAELRTTSTGNTLAQVGQARCPAGATTLTWELPVFGKLASTFEMLVKSYAFDREYVTILRTSNPRLVLGADAHDVGFTAMVWSGFEHIGAAPSEWHDEGGFKLADGIDHVLFLLALLLAGGTLWQLVGIATGFTVGHSITLALALLNIVRIPGSIIEPLVALTIAITALEAVLGKWSAHRWKIATVFGLIHGFAFAGALGELSLTGGDAAIALLGFNLGVELGQVAVIVVLAPLILALHRYRPAAARWMVRIVGGLVFLAGMYWFVERTFL